MTFEISSPEFDKMQAKAEFFTMVNILKFDKIQNRPCKKNNFKFGSKNVLLRYFWDKI